jgi:hypothetical protein
MSVHVGRGMSTRSSSESKRLTDIIHASYRRRSSLSFSNKTAAVGDDEWMKIALDAGFLRVVLKGELFIMDGGSREPLSLYLKHKLAEDPGMFFYIIDDPSRGEDSRYLVIDSQSAIKILSLGWMP